MKNPCLSCDIHLSGRSKDGQECRQCAKRVAYVRAIGGMTHSMPDRLMDIMMPPENQNPEGEDMTLLEKICSKTDCKHGGRPQPLDNFDNNPRAADGKVSICKSCRRAYQRSRSAAKPSAKKARPVVAQQKTQAADDMLPALFADRPELLDKLTVLAAQKMRTPVCQLLYLVQSAGVGEKI